MEITKQVMNMIAIIIFTSVISSCGQSNANNDAIDKTNSIVQKTEQKASVEKSASSKVYEGIEKASAQGKAAFVVVTAKDIPGTEDALSMANAALEIIPEAVVLQMNRDDPANAKWVKEWRLSGAPLPLILVFSSKGTLTGGRVLNQATAETIASLVPSPKLEMVYEAISNKKNAIVVFTKKSFADREEVIKECNEAVTALGNEAVLVEVDMDDTKETGFMNQVRINPETTTASVTLVINKQGQVAGTSKTVPVSEKLVAAAKTPVKSGCGPGCGPAGCGQ